jgi:membrane-bound acyltransferase YfiQ involved in biofilm formation
LQPEESPVELARPKTAVASIVAALAFGYTLVVTLVLLFLESFFADEDNQRTVLVWLTLPIVASFLGWMAVSSPNPYLKISVWFLLLAVLFFCWLTIFSIGLYYLPVPLLMVMSVLGPWDGHDEDTHS